MVIAVSEKYYVCVSQGSYAVTFQAMLLSEWFALGTGVPNRM